MCGGGHSPSGRLGFIVRLASTSMGRSMQRTPLAVKVALAWTVGPCNHFPRHLASEVLDHLEARAEDTLLERRLEWKESKDRAHRGQPHSRSLGGNYSTV